MHLQKNQFALAAAGTIGLVYIVCVIVVIVAPNLAVTLFSWLTHLVNLEEAKITIGSFIGGILQVLIYTYFIAWVFAGLHNKFIKQ